MSVGGLSIEAKDPGFEKEPGLKTRSKGIIAHKNIMRSSVVPLDQVTAYINPGKCINCGTCREICPVKAIAENQRIICHGCPICTDKPGISPQAMEEVATASSCTTGCPLHVSPQGYIGLSRAGLFEEAFKLIWDKNPLPSVCGSVCHHPCEDACKRGILVDSPIKIRGIKKYLSENETIDIPKYKVLYEEKVAVIGAGPAGLTAGHYLASMGYEVTIFESSPEAGGMLKRGIPEFRLRRDLVDRDIARLQNAGLKILLDSRVDKYALEKIRQNYDVVIIAAGTPRSKELQIPGYRLVGIMTALNFMERVNSGMAVRRHLGQLFNYQDGEAVIIGGGSVAMDAARTALRAGASKATVVCLESGSEVPAHQWEIAEAKEEGIEVIEGYGPLEFHADVFPILTNITFGKVKNFKKDENGRISFEIDKNSTKEIKADWAVIATGQAADGIWKEYEKESDIFYAGDVNSTKCSVVDAMANGRNTAIAVDAALRGREAKHPMDDHALALAPVMEKIFPYNRRKVVRPEVPLLDPAERVHSFDEVEGILNDEELRQEVLSCLGCGYEAVDEEKCVACGLCQKLCPKGDVITLVTKKGGAK